jgi:serine/threonine protein kinase
MYEHDAKGTPPRGDALLGPRYQKIRDINSGSYGRVQLAIDLITNEQVAIKLVERGCKITKYVERELINHSHLLHPHIVQVNKFHEILPASMTTCMLWLASGFKNYGRGKRYVHHHLSSPLSNRARHIRKFPVAYVTYIFGKVHDQWLPCWYVPAQHLQNRQRKKLKVHRPLSIITRRLSRVQFREVFLTRDHLAIAMEYAAGGDMFQHVTHRRGLSEDESRWFFQQLILGLDYCHKMVRPSRVVKHGAFALSACDGREPEMS